MNRLDQILSLRRRIAALKPNSHKRAPLERELVMLVVKMLQTENRQDRRKAA